MIVFVSQRGGGQDLAAHVLNEHDNETVRVVSVEGTVADDVHGALAEMQIHCDTLTKAKNYLVSMSINPDPRQMPITEEQAIELANRMDVAYGTVGQPRVVVEHIKNERLHYHVITSRIDTENEKAIEIPFDRLKSMVVVREFCRDHGIELPEGYYKKFDLSKNKDKDFNLQEKFQFEKTGLSKEERTQLVTELWHRRDTPESFINSLEFHGYTLCNGKRPFVLVDVFGKPNSLPKLIADGDVRTKQVCEFLGEDRELPPVEDAIKAGKELIKSLKNREIIDRQQDRLELLNRNQSERRESLNKKMQDQSQSKTNERRAFRTDQLESRRSLRSSHLEENKRIEQEREDNKRTGFADVFDRLSGMKIIRGKLHNYQDQRRRKHYLSERQQLKDEQSQAFFELKQKQQVKGFELLREKRSLIARDRQELNSLHKAFELEQSHHIRAGSEHMPGVQLQLTPSGRPAMVLRAKQRHASGYAKEFKKDERNQKNAKGEIKLHGDFGEVTGEQKNEFKAKSNNKNKSIGKNPKDDGKGR